MTHVSSPRCNIPVRRKLKTELKFRGCLSNRNSFASGSYLDKTQASSIKIEAEYQILLVRLAKFYLSLI